MKDSLAPGIEHSKTVTVTPEMGVAHLGEGPGVFSTPSMIQLIEQTSLEGIQPHLDDGESTVGTMVHVWHRAAVPMGEKVTCSVKLLERDRRKCLFEVQVDWGDTRVGDGTHERFVVDVAKFGKK